MLIYIVIIIGLIFMGLSISKSNEFQTDYMSRSSTTNINGLFTLLVFLSHATQSYYMKLGGVLDKPYITFKGHMSQMIVVTFLFYSGYGLMQSIKSKGLSYIKSLPTQRFLKVLLHFDIAVLLFVVLNLIIGKEMTLNKVLLSFTGWIGIGNSNWYIFVVLCLYALTFISFLLARGNKYVGTGLMTAATIGFVYLLMSVDKESWFYDTAILFPAGMIFALIKDRFDKLVMKNDIIYFCVAGIALLAYMVAFKYRGKGIEMYSVYGLLFMLLVVLFTMKVKISNSFFTHLGNRVFSIYILQRIPMIVLSKFKYFAHHKYAFIIICFILTLALAEVFDFAVGKLDGVLFKKKTPKLENKEL